MPVGSNHSPRQYAASIIVCSDLVFSATPGLGFWADITFDRCRSTALVNERSESYTQVCLKKHKNLVDTVFLYL